MENNNEDDFISPYDVLGVDVNSSIKEVKQAFANMAKITHPDKHNGNEDFFNLVYKSYKIITAEKEKLQPKNFPGKKDYYKYDKIISDELGEDYLFQKNENINMGQENDNNNSEKDKINKQNDNDSDDDLNDNQKCSLNDRKCMMNNTKKENITKISLKKKSTKKLIIKSI